MEGHSGLGLLRYNITLMRTIGLWPLDTQSRPLLAINWLYTALLVVSLATVSLCQVIEIFVSPDITSMASAVDLATLTASALFKMVYIIWYRKYFQDLVDQIDSTFVQNDFFAGSFSMSNWVKPSKMYITIYVCLSGPALLLLGGLPPYFVPQYFNRYHSGEGDGVNVLFSETERIFPFKCWFPFEVTWSPLYEIVYILELVPLVGSGHIYMVSDSFFFMVIYLTCGQLELLKTSYRGLQEKLVTLKVENCCPEESSAIYKIRSVSSPYLWKAVSMEKQVETKLNKALIKCIDFHNNLIDIINEIDALLRSMVMVDFIHAVVSLSFASLQMYTSNTVIEWFQMCVYIGISIAHQFLNNYFGETLKQQQMSVAEAVYDTPWVDGTDLHKMTVYMTINQANHPTTLSGWRMYHLGLGTFVEFMKLLASYVLVLQSLQMKDDR